MSFTITAKRILQQNGMLSTEYGLKKKIILVYGSSAILI